MSNSAAIVAALERVRDDIRASMASAGVNASGRTSAALAVVDDENGVRLVKQAGAVAPMDTLEIGRGGGAVPRGFYEIIKQWSRDKGIVFDSEQQRGTFAYLTARKIAREGTQRHSSPIDVYSTIVRSAVAELTKVVYATVTAPVLRAVKDAQGG